MRSITDLIQNKKLLQKALQIPARGKKAGYERLEFLGDRVVGLVVAEMLYTLFPTENEGEMAKRFVALTCEEALADIARKLNLSEFLKTNETELCTNNSILSDVVEALMAALYLDQGLDAVKAFMKPLWFALIKEEKQVPQDPKSALQEWAQQKYKELPTYIVVDQVGADHAPHFTVEVNVAKYVAKGEGTSKKQAEKQAALNLLKKVVK